MSLSSVFPRQTRNSLLQKTLTQPRLFRRGAETGCPRPRGLFRRGVFPETANGWAFPNPTNACCRAERSAWIRRRCPLIATQSSNQLDSSGKM